MLLEEFAEKAIHFASKNGSQYCDVRTESITAKGRARKKTTRRPASRAKTRTTKKTGSKKRFTAKQLAAQRRFAAASRRGKIRKGSRLK